MTQFDVFPNPSRTSRSGYPLLVVLQTELSAASAERVIAPLAPWGAAQTPAGKWSGRLAPKVSVDGEDYAVLVQSMQSVPTRILVGRVASLSDYRAPIQSAIDLLFFGV